MLIINGSTDDAGHEDPGHPERPERLAAVLAGVEDLHLGDDLLAVAPYAASRSELVRVHESTYLDQLGAFCYEGGGDLDEDTYATYDSWSLAQYAAGAGLAVVREMRIRGDGVGFVAVRPPGHHALRDRADIQPGETLLVLGAAGAVGLAAVEIGRIMGARIMAAASTDEKLELCRQRGADETINYAKEDLKARVRELTDGAGADVVYDPVGGAYSEPALRATAWNGRYLVIGFAAGEIPRVPLNLPLLRGCSIVGVFWGSFVAHQPEQHRRNVAELTEWWRSGRLAPHVFSSYPLERAADAFRDLAERRVLGKVVVTPG